MKATEIRELSITDLKERIETEKANLSRLKMNHAISPLDDLSQINKAKTNIARMLTILGEMEIKKDK
ncbi:MAG: 50S ribosomal protein L29 [Bacteroidetes bacterium GWF2_41_61]|jgi:large subunit ribosomal protein L29|nr:MAG: 50S ribosomal protein L29 [Bacteroidetes bacterium GWE2_40_15]OFY32510.1 MAG: 50S ribosomal protein L29 [Bacteroidetes bacterium GWF2_41_61]OFY89336.1 MAG: 50S ribosomal protein L29 [Bacteroidetes bacterium RIFOXYA12_FULL_40_10]PKP06892.1 MAG: 50S ribosomal protein L29 [Bacteroidetes bacterium HGW-Bacteroidetes-5]HBG24391.1 50S ribosomal protein L29 [Rikenellaceae bacterium]